MNDSGITIKKIITFVLTQTPAGIGLYKLWPQAVNHPYQALGWFILYEGIISVGAFLRKVWREHLEKDALKLCADVIRISVSGFWNWMRRFFSRFQRQYLKCLALDFDIVNDSGLGLKGQKLELTEIFVDLRIAHSPNVMEANCDPLSPLVLEGSKQIWDFLKALKSDGTALAIIGAPGSGKTTLLYHVLLTYAKNRQWRRFMHAKLPVMIFLREHATQLASENPPDLPQLIEEQNKRKYPDLVQPVGWFARSLARGKCIILLDGLDEVADEDKRSKVSAWVDRQITRYSHSRFLVTSRPQGYRTSPMLRAHVLEVQPFTPAQVRLFVEKWYLANEIERSKGKKDDAVKLSAQKNAKDLLVRIGSVPALSALTVNPLLLTMITMVHCIRGKLPGNRVKLYEDICHLLLERWAESKDLLDSLSGDQKLIILRPLAAYMMERRIKEISTADAIQIIHPYLVKVGLRKKEKQQTFLHDLQASSGLLLEREQDRWSFAHLTFQEYLTAVHWTKEPNIERPWDQLVGDAWWHETLRLYSAQADATGIVQSCFVQQDPVALSLAWDCLEEAQQLSPEIRQEAETRLNEAIKQPGTEGGRLAAEAMLARRLIHGLSNLNENVQLDSNVISIAEYNLFVQDMQSKGLNVRPESWNPAYLDSDQILSPIKGISVSQALTFCDWLTNRTGERWKYRLPLESEVSTTFIERANNNPFYILKSSGGYDLYGKTASMPIKMILNRSSITDKFASIIPVTYELLSGSDWPVSPELARTHQQNPSVINCTDTCGVCITITINLDSDMLFYGYAAGLIKANQFAYHKEISFPYQDQIAYIRAIRCRPVNHALFEFEIMIPPEGSLVRHFVTENDMNLLRRNIHDCSVSIKNRERSLDYKNFLDILVVALDEIVGAGIVNKHVTHQILNIKYYRILFAKLILLFYENYFITQQKLRFISQLPEILINLKHFGSGVKPFYKEGASQEQIWSGILPYFILSTLRSEDSLPPFETLLLAREKVI